MKPAISDGPIARADDRGGPWRPAAVAASMILHAGLLAAAFAGLTGRFPPTDPEPLSIELVVEQDAGSGSAGGGDSGSGAPAGSGGRSGGGLPAGSEAGPMPAAAQTAAPANAPAPPAVVPPAPTRQPPRPPRQEAAKASSSAATKRQQQQRAAEPARPSATSQASPPTTDEPTSVAASAATPSSAAASDASAGVGDIVASLGATAGGGSAGAGRSRGGATGSAEAGASRGPGYALGSAANPMPPYPPSARRRGIEGTVVLRVLVSADGRALSVEIAHSSGSDSLDEAARDTIGRWRFRPATRGGEAMTATASVPVEFTLLER